MAITFADRDPITVAFVDHCLALTIRIKEIRTARLHLPGLTIRAVYKIVNAAGRVEFVRQGPVQVELINHARVGNRQLIDSTVLQGSLDNVFKASIPLPDLKPRPN